MGMSLAPTIANLYVTIHEIAKLLPHLHRSLMSLKRFIDDGFGIWLYDSNPALDKTNWEEFQDAVNSGGLCWTFTKQNQSIDFMGMTLEIENGKFESTFYAKPLALHLYIPPHSCNPPGNLSGLIFGNIRQIYQLCSKQHDIEQQLCTFFSRLLDRGFQPQTILPLFDKAMKNAQTHLSRSKGYRQQLREEHYEASRRRVCLHLPFHPDNPPSRQLQHLWRKLVAHPLGKRPLNRIKANLGESVPIDQMIICYSRAHNIGN